MLRFPAMKLHTMVAEAVRIMHAIVCALQELFGIRLSLQGLSIRLECHAEHKGEPHIMAALDDVKAAESAIDKAISDVSAYLTKLADQVAGGITADEGEALATELNAKAAALEALVPSVPPSQ